jgi:hypothetical protein
MATTTYSRHPVSYGSHQKALPVTLPPPGKGPMYTQPISRVADAPEFSDSSTTYSSSGRSGGSFSVRSGSSYAGSHSGTDYDSHYSRSGIDVVEELSERMNSAFDPLRLDKSLAKQAQT